jgi:hypothetical protein
MARTRNKVDEIKRRHETFDAMSPALRAIARKIEQKLNGDITGWALAAHAIGTLLLSATEKNGVFDGGPTEMIVRYTLVPGGKATLIDYIRVAQAFDAQTLKRELKKPMQNGKPLSLYHFIDLARARPHERPALIELIRRECLSVDDLRKHLGVYQMRETPKRGAGRKTKRPTSPIVGLSRLVANAQRLLECVDGLPEVLGEVAEMPPGNVNARLLQTAESADSATASAIAALQEMRGKLNRATERVQRVLGLRAADQTTDEQ